MASNNAGHTLGVNTMNRTIYNETRRSIRDNGIRYTYAHAIDTDNTDVMFTCEDIMNVAKETDWLALRASFMRNGSKPEAIRLTTWIKK